MPYAYTEQGVAMLSAVLRSDTAVQVSIQTLRVRIPPLANEKALRVQKGLERYILWGWDGGIRTPNSRHQKPEFYR